MATWYAYCADSMIIANDAHREMCIINWNFDRNIGRIGNNWNGSRNGSRNKCNLSLCVALEFMQIAEDDNPEVNHQSFEN